jgi:hypothetical protein
MYTCVFFLKRKQDEINRGNEKAYRGLVAGERRRLTPDFISPKELERVVDGALVELKLKHNIQVHFPSVSDLYLAARIQYADIVTDGKGNSAAVAIIKLPFFNNDRPAILYKVKHKLYI